MYQPTVTDRQMYIDNNDKDHFVIPVELVLVQQGDKKIFPCVSSDLGHKDWCVLNTMVRSPRKYYKAYLVSKDQEIQDGDHYLNYHDNHKYGVRHYVNGTPDIGLYEGINHKIVVLPDHLHKLHLDMITTQELLGGALVKVDEVLINNVNEYLLHLDHNNKATIFPQEPSIEQVAKSMMDEDTHYDYIRGFQDAIEWYKKNGG